MLLALLMARPGLVFAESVIEQTVSIEKKVILEVPEKTEFLQSSVFKAIINGEEKEVLMVGVLTDRDAYSSCFRERSAREVQRRVAGAQVDLFSDEYLKHLENGRALRYIRFSSGEVLNEYLIREGFYYLDEDAEFSKKKEYLALEQQARDEKKGIWGSELTCEVLSFLDYRQVAASENFIFNISVYQLIQLSALVVLLLLLMLIIVRYSE